MQISDSRHWMISVVIKDDVARIGFLFRKAERKAEDLSAAHNAAIAEIWSVRSPF